MAKSYPLRPPTPYMRRALTVLVSVAFAAPAAWPAADAQRNASTPEQVRLEVRKAVEAHRAQERDDIRRQEAEVGRRLTAAERAELREQVRYQWLLPGKTAGTGKVEGPLVGPSPGPGPGTSGSAP